MALCRAGRRRKRAVPRPPDRRRPWRARRRRSRGALAPRSALRAASYGKPARCRRAKPRRAGAGALHPDAETAVYNQAKARPAPCDSMSRRKAAGMSAARAGLLAAALLGPARRSAPHPALAAGDAGGFPAAVALLCGQRGRRRAGDGVGIRRQVRGSNDLQGHRRRARRLRRHHRDQAAAAQFLRRRADQSDRRCARRARCGRRLPRRGAGRAGQVVLRRRQFRRRLDARRRGQRPGEAMSPIAHLYIAGGAAVPREEADRRRDPRRRGRRRARARHGAGFPRDLPGGALLRQLHPARLPSRASA